ncbi:MAG: transposase [Parcubacteria group bacterium]|jgi:REP element-mobilizing transposase RayT
MRRKVEFINEQYYHVYNRGVEKRDVFLGDPDYLRFLKSLNNFNQEDPVLSLFWNDIKKKNLGVGSLKSKLVDIIVYCLNPNHFHLLLKQRINGGISEFMKRLGTGYTGYFNHKHERSGVLFQGRFKSIHVNSNAYLLYLSAYINENNFIHGYSKDSHAWKYSSYLDYIGKRQGKMCDKNIILDQFNNNFKQYEEFSKENALHLKNKKEDEKYLLEI